MSLLSINGNPLANSDDSKFTEMSLIVFTLLLNIFISEITEFLPG